MVGRYEFGTYTLRKISAQQQVTGTSFQQIFMAALLLRSRGSRKY
jgi:hypothetical protein